jgi:hypothetical protein
MSVPIRWEEIASSPLAALAAPRNDIEAEKLPHPSLREAPRKGSLREFRLLSRRETMVLVAKRRGGGVRANSSSAIPAQTTWAPASD